jgi:hypothetical protein
MTGNFNQIDYSKQFEMFEKEFVPVVPEKEKLSPEIISEVEDDLSHHSSEYKPFTRRRAAKANRK